MNKEQQATMSLMVDQVEFCRIPPVQALTMGLNYYKGGYYDTPSDKEFEVVVKAFGGKYMHSKE